MTKVLEDAIEKVRRLPEDQQAYVAEILEQIAAAGSDPFVVPQSWKMRTVASETLEHGRWKLKYISRDTANRSSE